MSPIRLGLAVTFCRVVQRQVSSAKPHSPRPRSDRLLAALVTALVYGLGGTLVIHGVRLPLEDGNISRANGRQVWRVR